MAEAAIRGAKCSSGAILGFSILDIQGHFEMQLGGAGILTIELSITRWLAVPPELQPMN